MSEPKIPQRVVDQQKLRTYQERSKKIRDLEGQLARVTELKNEILETEESAKKNKVKEK